MVPAGLDALIFDFDRTLVPLGNFVRWRDAAARMRERYQALGVPHETLDAAPRGCFGLYGHVARSGVLARGRLAEVQREVSGILARYEAEGVGKADLMPGARELIAALPELGLVAGIVSSNPEEVIRRVLEDQGVLEAFVAIVGRDGLDDIKPSPEGMLRCCKQLGISPQRCLGIGDNAGDLEASRAAGMPAVGVATGVSTAEHLRQTDALEVFADLHELHRALRESRSARSPRG
jgi:phosphoglycolate phosphatase